MSTGCLRQLSSLWTLCHCQVIPRKLIVSGNKVRESEVDKDKTFFFAHGAMFLDFGTYHLTKAHNEAAETLK